MAIIKNTTLENIIRLDAPPYSFGTSFTATKNSVTNVDLQIPIKFAFHESEYFLSNALLPDSFSGYLIDIDNVLGLGANTVLGQFANAKHSAPDTLIRDKRDFITVISITGLYIRLSYTSTATVLGSDVTGYLNLNGFNLNSIDI